jgi:hypothetical protein
MNGESWGHTIRPLRADEKARWSLFEAASKYAWRHPCRWPRCAEPPIYMVLWRYIAGRSGRTSETHGAACDKHGRSFAEKHRLTLPTHASSVQAGGANPTSSHDTKATGTGVPHAESIA